MSKKSVGISYERELVHLMWKHGYAALRVAGSGSSQYPSCDVLAGNGHTTFAFECKSYQEGNRYISKQDIEDFTQFATTFGAQPWLAIRFKRQEWHFIPPENLKDTTQSKAINLETLKNKGLLLQELLSFTSS